MHDSTAAVLIITFTFLLAGMVKGVIGMGLPTVAMGLLALVMPPVQVVVLLVVANVCQLVGGGAKLRCPIQALFYNDGRGMFGCRF